MERSNIDEVDFRYGTFSTHFISDDNFNDKYDCPKV